jgi:outer membrane protein
LKIRCRIFCPVSFNKLSLINIIRMKKFVKSSLTVIAVSALSLLFIQCNNAPDQKQGLVNTNMNAAVSSGVRIAYVNTDTLLVRYQLSRDLNEELLKKQEDARTSLNSQARVFESEMAEFQRKVENNGFLSRDRAESEQRRLITKQDQLKEMNARLSNEIMVRQQEISSQLLDTISGYLKVLGQDMEFDMILSTTVGGTVLYARDGMDITDEVVSELNRRYSKK